MREDWRREFLGRPLVEVKYNMENVHNSEPLLGISGFISRSFESDPCN